jgi:plasmid stabilization system protein ParE
VNIEFLEPAVIEFDQAVAYYDNEQQGLGEKFRLEIQRSLLRIANYPESYQAISLRSRRCLVAKFPYGIIYQYKNANNSIVVVAIAHLHRKPDYWSSRDDSAGQ